MCIRDRVVLEFIKMGVAFDNGGILAVNPTPARSANASSQTKSFINVSLPIFHFPLIFQVGSQRAVSYTHLFETAALCLSKYSDDH